jgi:hypothetical protein
MDDQLGRPIQGISGREAAAILGLVNEMSVYRLAATGVLTKPRNARHAFDRDQVEQVALQRYRPSHASWAST